MAQNDKLEFLIRIICKILKNYNNERKERAEMKATLAEMTKAFKHLTEAQKAPRRVVRDGKGRMVGVEIIRKEGN